MLNTRKFTVAVLVCLACVSSAQAQAGPPPPPTNILYGFINSNRTLTFNSPGPYYYLVGDIVIQPGATLTIQPGVTILASANRDTLQGGDYTNQVEIDVAGSLVADASQGDSIKILSLAGGGAQWGQIKIENGASLNLNKVAIRGASQALNVLGAGTRNVANTSIGQCPGGIEAGSGALAIQQCVIDGLGPNSSGTGIDLGSQVITAPLDSIDAVPTIVSNFSTGVRVGRVVYNMISYRNAYGFVPIGGVMLVDYCTAANNSQYGFLNTNAVNCIAASNGTGFANCWVSYSDSWANGSNFSNTSGGQNASFSPFFVNQFAGDFHLGQGSIFNNFSNSGGQIGAYGPGAGPPTAVHQATWGRILSLYRSR